MSAQTGICESGTQTVDGKHLRTLKQNSAEHKWFRDVADALNDAGYSVNDHKVIRIDVPFTDYIVKREMFSRIAEAMFGEAHTSRLTKKQTRDVIEVLMRHLAETHGVYVPFPHENTVRN